MAIKAKYPASEALKVIDDQLTGELAIHRFDKKTRTKSHLFAVNGPIGRQFAIVLGDTDVRTGHHPALQTRILLEHCTAPQMEGIEPMASAYHGHRIKKNQDSKLAASNQSSFLVENELALKQLLRWYAK